MPDNSRRYRSILPAGGESNSDQVSSNSTPSRSSAQASSSSSTSHRTPFPRKRRRIGTQVACDVCRQRKARCDGQKPCCGWCRAKGLPCHYADNEARESATSRSPDASGLLELIGSVPEEEALTIFNKLRESQGSPPVLPAVREAIEAQRVRQARPLASPESLTRSSRPVTRLHLNSTLEAELIGSNPVAYPPPPAQDVYTSQASGLLRPYRLRDPESSEQEVGLAPPQSDAEPEEIDAGVDLADLQPDVDADGIFVESLGSEPAADNKPALRFRRESSGKLEMPPSEHCDPRLEELDITYWTKVPIDSWRAANVISLYLETDHPLLGVFDPDMFVEDLIQCRKRLCSSFLVNTILFLGCQMYSALDKDTYTLVQSFCEEAEKSWNAEKSSDTLANVASLQLLSQAYVGHGRDHCVLRYRNEALKMGTRMSLLGVDTSLALEHCRSIPDEMRLPSAYAAWGVFNWTILTALFYQQPGFEYPEYPPVLSVPDPSTLADADNPPNDQDGDVATQSLHDRASATYMGNTFPALCGFWRILHGVTIAYHQKAPATPEPPSQHVTLDYAELKFRELLSWAEALPPDLILSDNSPHHVVIFHIWFHAAILDLFRPFLRHEETERLRLSTFYSAQNTPDAAFNASVKQLKRLIIFFRSRYPSSTFTILWHTALVYVANAALQDTNDPEWKFYLLLCIYGYESLRRSYHLAEVTGRALLSMTLRNGDISSHEARYFLQEMKDRGLSQPSGDIRATFMADLDLAMTDPDEAKVERLAQRFEDLALFQEFTNF